MGKYQMTYFIYENLWGHEYSHSATIHFADCTHCNNGQGRNDAHIKDGDFSKWHGPFRTFQEAKDVTIKIGWKVKYCRVCEPHLQ